MADQELDTLEENIAKAWDLALAMGLDPFPVYFEMVPSTIMYEFGSYGLPGRFSHWTRGKAYHRMKTSYDFGLSKIYELVINTNPSYAFLLENNSVLENSFVAAHVFGHTDFFKHNAYFAHTARNMVDRVSASADRIRQYEFDHGRMEVERFLDAVLAIEEHVDHNVRIKAAADDDVEAQPRETPYDDLFKQENKRRDDAAAAKRPANRKFPKEPVKDIMGFLAEHAASLEPWQRDILMIVREEMLYFVPQMQTKIMNEGWACLLASSLVLTDHGLIRYDELHRMLAAGQEIVVANGAGALDGVTDRHVTRQARTIRLQTRRGLVLEGAEGHKLSIGPDHWLDLKDVQVGQRIPLSIGANIWAEQLVRLPRSVASQVNLDDGVMASPMSVGNGKRGLVSVATRAETHLNTPTHVTEELAEFLGYLIGNGSLSPDASMIVFTCGDREMADRYAALVADLFGGAPQVVRDDQTVSARNVRWHVIFNSTNVVELLETLEIDLAAHAPQQQIPPAILRSPKLVVSTFIRANCDCAGSVSLTDGAMLATRGQDIAQTLQIVLLNYGILSRRQGPNIHIIGQSARLFAQEIGFGLASKREQLREYTAQHHWDQEEDATDEVVSVAHDVADVYDITVDRSHRYVANGMLHHNSIAHSRIMREMDLPADDHLRFATLHTGVLAPSRTNLNPYYLGFKIWEDIERRWNNPTPEDLARGREKGQGQAKIFEVRETDNDVSFLRNYLTKDLVKELDLYLYRKEGDEWVIVEKDWTKVRDGIVASMTNFGYPYLVIDDADFHKNSELYLKHLFEGQEMDLAYADKTLSYVYQIWGRPVHLETVYDEKRVLLSFDGERSTRQVLEDEEK